MPLLPPPGETKSVECQMSVTWVFSDCPVRMVPLSVCASSGLDPLSVCASSGLDQCWPALRLPL